MIRVTKELLRKGENGQGGWNRQKLKILGVDWPPHKGWIREVLNMEITEAEAVRFVELKGQKKTAQPTMRLF